MVTSGCVHQWGHTTAVFYVWIIFASVTDEGGRERGGDGGGEMEGERERGGGGGGGGGREREREGEREGLISIVF